jgi:hypothetical protein
MAQPKWLDKYLSMKPDVVEIFDDLDEFREFCVEYGHVFDERNLYNERAPSYSDYLRHKSGKWTRNQWFSKPESERKHFKPRDGNRGNYNRSGNGGGWKR